MNIYQNSNMKDLQREEWRMVPDWPRYMVSSLGRVKTLLGTPKIKKQIFNQDGYLRTRLQINKKILMASVHRLVAQVFIPNPENKPCVNHIDGIKSNNSLKNLEWVTIQENSNHASINKLFRPRKGENSPQAKITNETAKEIYTSNLPLKILAEQYNSPKTYISNIKHGKDRWAFIKTDLEKGLSKIRASKYLGVTKYKNKWKVVINLLKFTGKSGRVSLSQLYATETEAAIFPCLISQIIIS